MKRIAIFVVLSACTGTIEPLAAPDAAPGLSPDAGQESDASTPPMPSEKLCGAALPMSAPASIGISGSADLVTAQGSVAADGASVELWTRGAPQPLATDTTDGGDFSVTAATNNAPLDAYVHVAMAGFTSTYFFPTAPFSSNIVLGPTLPVFEPTAFDPLYETDPQEPSTGIVFVMMEGCAAEGGVTGATVAVSPAGSSIVRYLGDGDTMLLAPTSRTSGAIISNVPAGDVTITTSNGTRPLRTGRARVFTNSMSIVDLFPQ